LIQVNYQKAPTILRYQNQIARDQDITPLK